MLLESLLIAIFAGIAGIDLFNGLFHIHRPIVTGAIVGLILGDLKMASTNPSKAKSTVSPI